MPCIKTSARCSEKCSEHRLYGTVYLVIIKEIVCDVESADCKTRDGY